MFLAIDRAFVFMLPILFGTVTNTIFKNNVKQKSGQLMVFSSQKKTFTVVHMGRAAGLTLDWSSGFSLSEGTPGAQPVWSYR